MMRVLGVDGGQTGCRAAVCEGELRLGQAEGKAYHQHHGDDDLSAFLAGPMEAIDALGSAAQGIEGVALGLTGLPDSDELRREMGRRVVERLDASRARVAGDVVTAHAGALQGATGVVVSVGTGVHALATSADGRHKRSGGRGYLLGDQGSGFAIGQAGLRAAGRAVDGSDGGSTTLLRRVEARFGTTDRLRRLVYGPGSPVGIMASFAREVIAAAEEGDHVSLGILAEAGREIAVTTLAAAQCYEPGEPFRLSWNGRLINSTPLLQQTLVAAITSSRPEAEPMPPRGDGLQGALLLASIEEPTQYDGLIEVYEV